MAYAGREALLMCGASGIRTVQWRSSVKVRQEAIRKELDRRCTVGIDTHDQDIVNPFEVFAGVNRAYPCREQVLAEPEECKLSRSD